MANTTPTTEKRISAILLVVLVGIVGSVFSGAFITGPTEEKKAEVSYTVPAGWKISGSWETYPNGKLYEKIDGRETLFQSFGVIRLDFAVAEFNGKKFDIYLYLMKDIDAAIGVYLDSSSEQTGEINLAAMTNVAGGELRAFKTAVYLEIQALEKSPDEKLLRQLAASLLSNAKSSSSSSSLFDRLPIIGRVSGSLAYNKETTFGLKSLAGTYSASYEEDGRQTDYLIKKVSAADAANLIENVRKELMEFEGKVLEHKSDRLAGELLDKKLFLVIQGNLLLGAYGEDATWDRLTQKLRKPNS